MAYQPETEDRPRSVQINRREWQWVAGVSAILLCLCIALNVWGYVTTPADLHFGGLVYNWQDNNTYLAKIWQGIRGDWQFSLPYSAEPGPGVFVLYANYLLLGHVARLLSLEPDVIFNLTRLIFGALLLASLYRFTARLFPEPRERRLSFLLATIGSGFGILAILFGQLTPDIWQAELSTFLSILSNPHYPLAIAACLWLLEIVFFSEDAKGMLGPRSLAVLATADLILAITQPYALVAVVLSGSLWVVIRWFMLRRIERTAMVYLAIICVLAIPFAAYDVWIIRTNAYIAELNSQDITVTPSVEVMIAASGLLLVAAVFGVVANVMTIRRSRTFSPRLAIPLLWFATIALLIYVPGMQQRRFALGWFVPLGMLAAQGILSFRITNAPLVQFAFVTLSCLTNVLVLVIAFAGLTGHPGYLYLTQNEWMGLMYLRASADQHAVVLASPDMGLFIPAWAGQRVVYGHPYETLHARENYQQITRYFSGQNRQPDDFLRHVDYVFIGPREKMLGNVHLPPSFTPVFAAGDVSIFQRRQP